MRVSKYNASGNDFVIFHAFVSTDRAVLARRLCDRINGVGADGLIVLLPHENGIKWEFYNSDGSRAAMCGNGSRAAFLYAYENGLTNANARLLTDAGLVSGSVCDEKFCFKNGEICKDLKGENFDKNSACKTIGENFTANARNVEVELTSPVKLGKKFDESGFTWHFYDTGVPHLVAFTDDVGKFDAYLARELRRKYNANVNWTKFDGEKLLVRTYERGVEAETLACGTGMAACFYAGVENLNLPREIAVQPKSGEILRLRLEGEKIFFKGKVRRCFDAFVDADLPF